MYIWQIFDNFFNTFLFYVYLCGSKNFRKISEKFLKNLTFLFSGGCAEKGVFYQNNGEIITLTAPEAVYDVNNRDITIKGLVQVVSNNGATMQGDVFKWQAKESKLVGDGNIILKKEDTVLTGNHIEATAGLTKVKVQGNAKIIKGGK